MVFWVSQSYSGFHSDGTNHSDGYLSGYSSQCATQVKTPISLGDTHYEQLPVVFYKIAWQDGEISLNFISSATTTLFNIAPQEMTANPRVIWNGIHPEDHGKVQQFFKQAIESQQLLTIIFRFLGQDRMTKWLYSQIQSFHSQGQTIIVEGICSELSSYPQPPFQLSVTPNNFEYQLIEKLPYFLYLYDLQQGQYLYSNQALSGILGYQPQSLFSSTNGHYSHWTELIHPQDRERLAEHYQKCLTLQDTEELKIQYRIQDAQGRWRWFNSISKIFQRTPDGQPQQIIVTAHDITPYQKMKALLRKQKGAEKLLNVIARRIHQSMELDQIFSLSVVEMRKFLQVDRLLIYRFKPDWSGVVVFESVMVPWRSLLGENLINPELIAYDLPNYQQREIHAITDINHCDLSSYHINWLKQLQVKANLEVPIWEGEELWGLLVTQNCRSPRQWQEWEIQCLKQFSLHLGLALEQGQLHQELRLSNEELQRLAFVDGLTGVANRRRFDECLAQEWRRLAREQQPLSLILCDIDYFKAYNDTYGHPAGDTCLQQLAQVMEQSVKRPADLVARCGGEEFAIILPNTDVSGAVHVAGEVRSRLRGLKIRHQGSSVSDYVTLSFGIATRHPTLEISPESLLIEADLALYQAKGQGRDHIAIAPPSITEG